ncbi:MAG TPA: succinyldiaminopimelate transaminase [Gammaproteobacteria bacterium]|nr:succinyldiaminopimelate transaminase [Gammaproteobacteria bacterium]
MNPALGKLQPYPFERLHTLLAGHTPPPRPLIDLSIGEPQHPAPAAVLEALADSLALLSCYPATRGERALREAIAGWLTRRALLAATPLDPERHVLPVNGTREALFAIAHCVIDARRQRPTVVMPNPFYQIYEGAALLAQAEPHFLQCPAAQGHLPDLSSIPGSVWERCQLLYLCTPGNPSGAVMSRGQLWQAIQLACRHGFVVISDECYGELYRPGAAAPPTLLEVAAQHGHTGFEHCLSFHSLSKRSNLPGLRSGFVAGDPALIEAFARYRTYHGCAMPLHHQRASTMAWSDETHVEANRSAYARKYAAVLPLLREVLAVEEPPAGFYLWPEVPGDDTALALRLFHEAGVRSLPGSYLARTVNGQNPGAGRLRLALVAGLEACVEAAERIRDCLAHAAAR